MRHSKLFVASSLALALAACGGKQDDATTAPPATGQPGLRVITANLFVENERTPAEFIDFLRRENPDVVVFGHTHKRFFEMIGNTVFLNPGYAGKQRFNLNRSVAVLHCDETGVTAEFTDL